MNRNKNLENQIAVITGSSKGIGREIARRFAQEGAHVVICGRNKERVDDTVNAIQETGGQALGYPFPISTKSDADRLVSSTIDRFGRLDILVNNAGIVKMEPFLECTEDSWSEHIDIHMTSTLLCSQAAARAMASNGYGRIVNISTIAANMANPGFAAYASVKAAVESLTKVMAVELAPLGITVNCVAPGPVMNQQLLGLYGEDRLRERVLTIPLKRLAEPEEVAHAVLFFVLKESGYITGQLLGVDGGAKAAGCFTAEIYRQRKTQPT
jgi:3-oxoacyl-[acyl-carrier protein] reductase